MILIEEYPQSEELKALVESKGWQLIDATAPESRNTALSWEELAERGPAERYVIGNNYIFAPIPQEGQTLRQAYAVTMGVGPSLQLDDIMDHVDMDCEMPFLVEEKFTYMFSRLNFIYYGRLKAISCFSAMPPGAPDDAKMPMAIIPWRSAHDKFQKYFHIVTPEAWKTMQYIDVSGFNRIDN